MRDGPAQYGGSRRRRRGSFRPIPAIGPSPCKLAKSSSATDRDSTRAPPRSIVQVASKFHSSVLLSSGARRASAHSIVAVMLLAAAFGSTIRVETSGPDEMAAMTAIVELIHSDIDTRI